MLERWICQTLDPRRCNCSQNIDQRVGKRFLFFFFFSFFISLCAILLPFPLFHWLRVYIHIVRSIVSGTEQSENRTAAQPAARSRDSESRSLRPTRRRNKIARDIRITVTIGFSPLSSSSLSLSLCLALCSLLLVSMQSSCGGRGREKKRERG